jgi:phosphatidylserine synthase
VNNILGRFGALLFIPGIAACPEYFPGMAKIGLLFGLGGLAEYENTLFYGLHVLILAMLVSHVIDFKRTGGKASLVLISISIVFFFLSLYVQHWEPLSYVALAVLLASSVMVWFVPHLEGAEIKS